MSIVITVNQKRARTEALEKLVKSVIAEKYPDASIQVERKVPPESRSDRFNEAQSIVVDAKSEAEMLRDELQEWMDGLPENLQNGTKADELQTAIDSLEEFIDACNTAENVSVEFPGMY